MNTPPKLTIKVTNTIIYFYIFSFIFLSLSVFSFLGKLELYRIANEIMEVSNVLIGKPAPSSYQGNQLMPNNNQTAYFVSNYAAKSYLSNNNYQHINRQYRYTYNLIPSNSINTSPQVFFVEKTSSELRLSNRKRKHDQLSNIIEWNDFKIDDRFAPLQLDLASAQSEVNVPFATHFETSNFEPFRVIANLDPDPEEPEGNPLPLGNDLAILLLIAGVYGLIKFYTFKN